MLLDGCGGAAAQAESPEWLTDVKAAREKAAAENKFVLMDFTGSDWCPWCIKLRKEVFDQPEFNEYAVANLILVEVDFPRHKSQDPEQLKANQTLAQSYGIQGFPTVIVTDPQGNAVGKTGYMPGGPRVFNSGLDQILSHARAQAQITANSPPPAAAQTKPAQAPRPPAVAPIPEPPPAIQYDTLVLKGVSGVKDHRIALINHSDFAVGDSATLKVHDQQFLVCCKEIRDDSVLITANGVTMELRLGQK